MGKFLRDELLQRHEDKHETSTCFKGSHCLSDHGPGRTARFSLHAVAWCGGRGDQVAWLDRLVIGIDMTIDTATERHGMPAIRTCALLAHEHARLHATRAADDAGDARIVSAVADAKLTRKLGV